MSHADHLELGDWNARCSMCGKKFKASQLSKNWQGMYRCDKCQEPRHPQDFVRSVPDDQSVPWAQPELSDYSLFCDLEGISAIPDLAMPDCSIPDNDVIL